MSSSAAALENESFHIVDGLYQASLNGREAYISHSEAAALTCEDPRRRDTRSDVARPRGVARPGRVVRGDRRGCHERLRVQPTCLRARHPPPLPGHTGRGRQEAAFSRHVMSCPRVGSVVNRGCVSELYVPTNGSQSLSVRPCRARAWFTSPSTGHHAGTCRRRAGSSFPARPCTPCRSP